MKIIHTADNHLDMPLSSLPSEKATARKRERLSAFTKMIDYTIAVNADMLLISGDLFDSSNPSDAILSYCVSEFEKLGNTPVFLVLGNHDYGIRRDVFPGNVHIFPNTLTTFTSQDFSVTGASFSSPSSVISPLLPPKDPTKTNILCLHGDLFSQGEYNPLNKEELLKLGYDYIALGHIHQCCILSPIAYPGCHDGGGFDEEGLKGFLECDIDKNSLNIRFIPSSSRIYETIIFDVSDFSSSEKIAEALKESVHDGIYKVLLTGKATEDFSPNLGYISSVLSQNAFFIKVEAEFSEDSDLSQSALYSLFYEHLKENCHESVFPLALKYGTLALKGEDIV